MKKKSKTKVKKTAKRKVARKKQKLVTIHPSSTVTVKVPKKVADEYRLPHTY